MMDECVFSHGEGSGVELNNLLGWNVMSLFKGQSHVTEKSDIVHVKQSFFKFRFHPTLHFELPLISALCLNHSTDSRHVCALISCLGLCVANPGQSVSQTVLDVSLYWNGLPLAPHWYSTRAFNSDARDDESIQKVMVRHKSRCCPWFSGPCTV